MTINKRHITFIIIGILIIAAGVFTAHMHKTRSCKSIIVIYDHNPGDTLIAPAEVIKLALKDTDSIIGKAIRDIDLESIRYNIVQSPFISDADISFGLSGVLKIYIEQEIIIARIINTAGRQFYITQSGYYFPTGKVSVRVPVFTGYISPLTEDLMYIRDLDTPVYTDIYLFAKALSQHVFMNALSEQIYVNRDKKFEVVPNIGIKNIVVGDSKNLIERFDNLQLFYEQKLPFVERTTYNELNISFDNQIIAKK